jgi:hypothetical protein
MAKQYLYPTRVHADIVVTGNDDIAREVNAVLRHVELGTQCSMQGGAAQ